MLLIAHRAWELEEAIAVVAAGEPESALSSGSWAFMSVLTRTGSWIDATEILRAILDDESRFQARLAQNRAAAEIMLVGGVCAFLENWDDERRARGEPLFRRVVAAVPQPTVASLHYAYACAYALLGEVDAAFASLEHALALGFSAASARTDTDLASLHGDRFDRLVVT